MGNAPSVFQAASQNRKMIESDRRGVPTTVLYNIVDPSDQVCLGGAEDIVVVATSALMLRESLELYHGTSSRLPFAKTEDYEKLRADVPLESKEPAGYLARLVGDLGSLDGEYS